MGARARWRALSIADRVRLGLCAALLPVVHLSLAVLGYARLRSLIDNTTDFRNAREATPADIRRARQLATLAGIAGRRGLTAATCLRQSLLLFGWLRCRGLRPTLQLGVKPQPGPFQAHAWVELEGVALLQSDAGHQPFVMARR